MLRPLGRTTRVGEHHIARAQHRREPDGQAETDQGDRALVAQLFGPGPRPQRAAAAHEDQRRVALGESGAGNRLRPEG